MNEQPGRRGFPFGFNPMGMVRPALRTWRLTVTGQTLVTPRMLRVAFSAPDVADLTWRPGQDLVLSLPQADGTAARRHYTIRELDHGAGRLDIDFVLHGASPAGDWARAAAPGQVIEAQGPRGRTHLDPDARRHLFCGDETCIPGIFAMLEALPAGAQATVLIEIDDPAEAQVLNARADAKLEWLSRDGAPAGPSSLLLNRLEALRPSPAETHAYVIGETSNVRAQRHFLLASGFDRNQITAEGYWRPGRVGGHDHV